MVKPKFENNQKVFIKIDESQTPYMIVGVILRPEDYFEYFISNGAEEFLIREIELTVDKQFVI